MFIYGNNFPVSSAFIMTSTIFSILFWDLEWFQHRVHKLAIMNLEFFYFSPTEKKRKIDGNVNLDIDGNGDLNNWW
jgi:hypothetical protein